MKKVFLSLLLCTFGALHLFAEDLSGNWTLKTQVAGRDVTLRLALKQNGTSLSGAVSAPNRDFPITQGSMDSTGNITILLGDGGGKRKGGKGNKGKGGGLAGAKITGSVDGDHLRLTIQTKNGQGEGIASKTQGK